MPRIRTHDDRGSRISLAHAGLAAACRDWRNSLPPLRWRKLPALAWRLARTGPGLAFIGACMLVGVFARVGYEEKFFGLGLLILTPVFVPLLMLAFASARGLLGLGGGLPEKMRRAMLARSICPACEYDLRGVPPGEDGFTVCPECAASWDAAHLGPGAHAGPEVIVLPEWKNGPE